MGFAMHFFVTIGRYMTYGIFCYTGQDLFSQEEQVYLNQPVTVPLP